MGAFLLKYKLYHIPFWLVYHFIWIGIYIGNADDVYKYFQSAGSIKFYFYVVFQVIGVYLNLYFLIPRYLHGRAYKTYIFSLLLLILSCTVFITSGYYVTAHFSQNTFIEIFGKRRDEYWTIFLSNALPSTLASMTLGMSIKLGNNWLKAEKKQLILQKESLETELKYLRSQINPHFLFNTINSIFALIHKNPDLASDALANFSDMLRYQLYECNEEKTLFLKELNFLENFINLERLRLDESQTVLKLEILNDLGSNLKVAPFILIPFIENAFKHVSKGKTQKNYIKMRIKGDNGCIYLNIENSRSQSNQSNKSLSESSGIGLKNVSRRLDLIYPNSYTLELVNGLDKYSVKLMIQL